MAMLNNQMVTRNGLDYDGMEHTVFEETHEPRVFGDLQRSERNKILGTFIVFVKSLVRLVRLVRGCQSKLNIRIGTDWG